MLKLRMLLAASAIAVASTATPASALNIVLRPDASFTSQTNGAAALFAFQKAANFWNQTLTGNTTINIAVGYRPLDPNVIAQAGSTRVDVSARDVYAALASHASTSLDDVAVDNLVELTAAGGVNYRRAPALAGDPLTGLGLNITPGSVFDNNDSYNNRILYANTSNLKELGLFTDVNSIDAQITFSSAFSFDFDPTDGISAGTQDFTSVAIHELGHALGFVSGTDFYDVYGAPNGPGATVPIAWDNESVLSVLDLFRYSTNPPANSGFDPATGNRFLQLDPNRGAGFSVDGVHFVQNDFNFANFSTGRYNGDGQQASHWKDSPGYSDENGCFVALPRQVGIMDPTSGSCQMGMVTGLDLAAFDAIGYNLDFNILDNLNYTFSTAQVFGLDGVAAVPEPASWAMMIGGFGLVGGTLRRRQSALRTA